jgi:hypothetical protein
MDAHMVIVVLSAYNHDGACTSRWKKNAIFVWTAFMYTNALFTAVITDQGQGCGTSGRRALEA